MRSIEKNNRKRESSNLPFSIGLVAKIGAVALGFYLWGGAFVWVVLGFVFAYRVLRGIASCLVTLISLAGFFWFLFTHIL